MAARTAKFHAPGPAFAVEILHHFAAGTDEFLAPAHHRPAARRAPPHHQHQNVALAAEAADQRVRDAVAGDIGVDQDAEPVRMRSPADAERTESGNEGFGNHEADAKQYQREPGVVHGQHLECVQRDQHADGTDHARHQAGVVN
jgi:hypothetical protein